MENYKNRQKDLEDALRQLRRQGFALSPAFQTAQGEMVIFAGDHGLTSGDILKLFDQKELTRAGIDKLLQHKNSSRSRATRE